MNGSFRLLAAVLLALSPAAIARADAVDVQVCAEDRSWQQPSPEEMARSAWHDKRYVTRSAAGVEVVPVLVPYYTQHFILFTLFSSGMSHAEDLTGLMPTHPPTCPGTGDDLHKQTAVEIWSIGYHVEAADVTNDTLTLKVEPNQTSSTGYEIMHVARPQQATWTARFVRADGTEVAVASPVHELVATAIDNEIADAGLPVGLPRPEDGHSVVDGQAGVLRDTAGRVTYARYLVLVKDGTAPLDEANAYQTAVASAGFAASTPVPNPDGSSTFSIEMPAATALVQEVADRPIPGALTVSLTFDYPNGN